MFGKRRWSGPVISFMDFLLTLSIISFAMTTDNQKPHRAVAAEGSLTIEMWWDKDKDCDVDLWAKPPEGDATGYSRPHTNGLNLLRDDLGKSATPDSMNYEIMIAPQYQAGEYIINVMLYRRRVAELPVKFSVKVTEQLNDKDSPIILFQEAGELLWEGQEITVVRFSLDENGTLIPSSVNKVEFLLRNAVPGVNH